MGTQRVFSYDLIKTIAIYCVCLYHLGTLNTNISGDQNSVLYLNYFMEGITGIGVPLFLMVNGALLMNRDYSTRKLLIKVGWLCFLYLLWGGLTLLVLQPTFDDHYTPWSFLEAVYFTRSGRTTHLWFLSALIMIYLLFPLVKAMYDKADKKYFAYLFLLVLVFTFGNQLLGELLNIAGYILDSDTLSHTRFLELPWFNPFSFDYSFSLVYFLAGGWLDKNKNLVPLKAGQAIIIVIVCALSISLFGIMKTSIDGMRYDTVWNGYDSILTLVMSSVMFLSISRISAPSKTVSYLASFVSSNTLGIYLLHIPLFFALSLKYSTLGMSDYFLCDGVFAFLVMSGSLLVSWFLSKVPFARRIVQV